MWGVTDVSELREFARRGTGLDGLAERLLLELRLTPRGDDFEPDLKLDFPTHDVDAAPARSPPRRVVSARTPY